MSEDEVNGNIPDSNSASPEELSEPEPKKSYLKKLDELVPQWLEEYRGEPDVDVEVSSWMAMQQEVVRRTEALHRSHMVVRSSDGNNLPDLSRFDFHFETEDWDTTPTPGPIQDSTGLGIIEDELRGQDLLRFTSYHRAVIHSTVNINPDGTVNINRNGLADSFEHVFINTQTGETSAEDPSEVDYDAID